MPGRNENLRILIADDSDILNNMLKDVFEENGYEVFQAFDGLEGKALFLKYKLDIALIDIQMPKADGLELLKFIRDREPRAICLMITGAGNEELAVKSIKMGASDYLTKPFGMREVVALVQRLIEDRRTSQETYRLERDIQKNEKYLAHLTNTINEALVTTDSSGKIRFINRAAVDLWGYSQRELRDEDLHLLIRAGGRTPLQTNLVRETITKGKLEGEFLFRKKDKGTFPGYLSASVITDGNKATGIVMVVSDLTKLYEVERRLKQSEKLASLGKVVEGIAHEVRNCLTSLGGFSKRLQKIHEDNPTSSEYTRIILEDVSRLEKMVRDIEEYVNFAKSYHLNYSKVKIIQVIEAANAKAKDYISLSSYKKMHFSLKSDKNIPEISADAAALEEVFYNLILNAYEAMPKGGKLTVSVSNMGPALLVSVADTGIGIPADDLSEIFNPFFTSKTTGAGMGLSKVYLLVEEHGGQVEVSSEKGKGTVFDIFLPIEKLLSGTASMEPILRWKTYKQ